MLHCRKSSEQFQTVLNLCEMLICGSVCPRKRKASSSFSRTSFQTEPPQCLFTILFKHSSAKHQSAMQRNLPSQALMQPSSRGQALSLRERWKLLSPTWAREYLIMGWTTGLQKIQVIHLQPDTESERTQLTSCIYCQCEERVSEKPTTSSYTHRYKLLNPNYL